jgi:hypothetical protein
MMTDNVPIAVRVPADIIAKLNPQLGAHAPIGCAKRLKKSLTANYGTYKRSKRRSRRMTRTPRKVSPGKSSSVGCSTTD